MLDCELRVDTELKYDDLVAWFAQAVVGGDIHAPGSRTVIGSKVRVDVLHHEEHDESRKREADGFLWYPFRVELEQTAGADRNAFVREVCALINKLRSVGSHVVALSEFDDEIIAATGWNWTKDNPIQPAQA